MPSYNGTYFGTPGTGGYCDASKVKCDSLYRSKSIFTTLYRDNYSGTCKGEGCGSHAGVDIAVPSGTPVVASLAGTIIETGCKEGKGSGNTGGTVIIEASNPYQAGKVYLVYAHLDKWSVHKVGDFVPEGEIVGYSGGLPTRKGGVCPGSSEGAHLHFQVDKNPPDSYRRPWFPAKGANTVDKGFEVSKYTYNPLPFVTQYSHRFSFAEAKNSEYWASLNARSTTVSDGVLRVDGESVVFTGRSSLLGDVSCNMGNCTRGVSLDADVFKKVVLDLDFKCKNGQVLFVYRGNNTGGKWLGFNFDYSSAKTYGFNLTKLSGWKGVITDFLISPSGGCTANPSDQTAPEYLIKQLYFF